MFRACNLCKSEDALYLFSKYGYPIVKCRSCGLVYTDIQLDDIPFNDFYDDKYYLGAKAIGYSNYVLNTSTFRRNFLKWLREIRKYKSGGNLLDVGCGTGIFLDLVRSDGWNVLGVEVSGFGAQYATSTFNIDVVNDDFLNASLTEDHFDVLTMWDTIEHLSDPLTAMTKAHKLLKAKGIFALLTGDIESVLSRLTRTRWRLMTPPLHLYYFSTATIVRALRETGFRPLKIIRPGKFVSLDLFLYQFSNLYLPHLQQLARVMLNRANLARFAFYINLKDEILVIAQKQ